MKLTYEKWLEILGNKKLIIFDLDGTLIESVGVWDISDQEVIKYYTGKTIDLDTVRYDRDYSLSTTTNPEIYYAYCGFLKDKYHIDASQDEIFTKRHEITTRNVREKVTFKEGAEDILLYLKSKGCLLAIATTTNRGSVDIYNNENVNTKHFDFDGVFDLILTKQDVVKKKPHPEIHEKILKHFHLSPEECIIFEDTTHGIEAGHNANIEVVGVISNDPNIVNYADYYINNFKEIL